MSRSIAVVAIGAVLGCGRIGYDPHALSSGDGAVPDSAVPDAAVVEAGAPDTGMPEDGGGPDATVGEDAGTDAGPDCIADPCVLLLPQCGCVDGEMCQRTGATTDERSCIPEGDRGIDESCGADAECVPGHACVVSVADARCHLYCDGDDDCAPGLSCARYDEGASGIGMCGSACTLEGGCPAGDACKVILVYDLDSDGPVALPLCGPPAGGAEGSACASSIDCAAGLYCDVDVCRPMCRLDGSLPCASGTCVAEIVPILLANIEHGFCR